MIGSSVLLTYQSIETASTTVESNEKLYNGDSEKQEYCSPNVPRVQQLKELHHVGLLICSGTSTLNIVHAVGSDCHSFLICEVAQDTKRP